MKKLNQSGAVSLLSVVIFATIITIVIAAYIRSAISQQNQASSYDFGTRAYYAAESGVQDAVRGIAASDSLRSSGQNTCRPLTNGNTSGQTAGQLGASDLGLNYTCQLITTTPTDIKGPTISDSINSTIRLKPVNPAGEYNLVIRWSETDTAATTELKGRDDGSKGLPPRDAWTAGDGSSIHPMLRTAIISLPTVGLQRDNIKQNVFFVNPVAGNGVDAAVADFAQAQSAQQNPASIVSNARCYPNTSSQTFGGYSCEKTIRLQGYNFANNEVYLRLKAIYGATEYSVALTRVADGSAVPLANTQAIIDVTGKVSNVYRRVRQTVSLNNGVQTDNWPEAALVAGDGICKLFRIGSTPSQFQSDCNPLQQ